MGTPKEKPSEGLDLFLADASIRVALRRRGGHAPLNDEQGGGMRRFAHVSHARDEGCEKRVGTNRWRFFVFFRGSDRDGHLLRIPS